MLSPARQLALTGGILYLLTFISIPTLALYGPVRDLGYITSSGPDTPAIVGAILELIVGLAGIGTAVALYPILKKQNHSLALGFVASRTLEASTIFAGVAFLLTVVALRQSGAGLAALPSGQLLVTLYDRVFLVGQSLMPGVNDIILGILFYRSRLLPRPFALLGIAGGLLLFAGDLGVLFGLFGQHAPPAALAAVPVALFEFVLGIWLIVRGFNPAALAALDARPDAVSRQP
jgi:hypothetical protein